MATLILNANGTSPLSITCQRAGKAAPRFVGSKSISYNGAERSSIRGQAKIIPIIASFVDTATEASIQAAVMNGVQIACSGDILGNIQTLCSIDGVTSNMIPGLAGFFEMSFTLSEVNASTVLLKYAPGDVVTGESFTRSTTAYYSDSTGALVSAAINAKRDSHYTSVGAARSILLEDARTNLLLRSEQFDNAAWSKTNITVTADAFASPTGAATADKIAATASAATIMTQGAVVAATSCTYTIYVHKGSGATDANAFGLYNSTTASNLLFLTINYDTGVITYIVGSSGATLTATGNNNWYRLTLTVTAGITSGNTITAYACFTGGIETATEYAYAWGAQLEAAPFASSYIPTVAATVTRGADSYSLPFTTPPQEMTLYEQFVELGTLSTGATTGSFGIGASTNASFFAFNSGGLYSLLHRRATDVSSAAAAAPSYGAVAELRALLYGDGSVQLGQSIASAAEVVAAQSAANALATSWFDTSLTLNNRSGSPGFIALQSLKIVSGARSLAEMRVA